MRDPYNFDPLSPGGDGCEGNNFERDAHQIASPEDQSLETHDEDVRQTASPKQSLEKQDVPEVVTTPATWL